MYLLESVSVAAFADSFFINFSFYIGLYFKVVNKYRLY